MKNFFKAVISPLILILLFTSLLHAGNGKIAGVIKNNLGEPVSGVSVLLAGSKLTNLTDDEGKYFILNISPGKYDITISAIGFIKKTVRSVEVISDLTTELNIQIEKTNDGLEEIVVDAERNLINKSMTSSKTIYSANEIEKTFGTSSSFEILQTAPSVYKGFLRGGLQNMTKTIVDGVDISDEYYAVAFDLNIAPLYYFQAVTRFRESQQATLMSINPNSISELSVNTGTLGSDYFSASAGAISYSLKEGKGTITGKIYLKTSSNKLGIAGPDIYNDKNIYFSERDALYARKTSYDSIHAKRYSWTEDKYENGQIPFETDISLGGSINKKLGFYFSTNYQKNPDCRLPNQRYIELNSILKLTYDLNSNIKITALGMLFDKGKLFGWKNSNYQEAWRYYLEGVPQNDGLNWVGSVKLSHFLSSNSFYELQVSNKNSNTRIGYVDGNNDGLLQLNEEGDFITWSDITTLIKYVSFNDYTKPFWAYPSSSESSPQLQRYGAGNSAINLCKPYIFYENFKNNVFTSKLDFTSQVSYNHQLKVGISYAMHNLDMNRKSYYFGGSNYPYAEIWNAKPIELGSYIQDKIEYAGFAVNLGLRFDLCDLNAADFDNYFNPSYFFSDTISNVIYRYSLSSRGKNIDPYTFFSPRISLSQHISDESSIYFSFSKTSQPQPYSLIYTNYNNFTFSGRGDNLFVGREPYKTTSYELGAQWKIFNELSMNINAYDVQIQNYLNSSFYIRKIQVPYYYYLNFSTGYADSKGVELMFEGSQIEFTDFLKISGRLSYTYSHIKIPNIIYDFTSENKSSFTLADTLKYGYQLPFDDVKYYSRVETEIMGGSSSLNAGYNREHRIVFSLLAEFPYDIFVTSIGSFQSGFKYVRQYVDPQFTGRIIDEGPWNKQIDVKIEKSFKIFRYKLSAFLDIKNLFNSENILAYDNSSTGYDLWQTKSDPTGTQKRPIGQDGSLFYDIPREIYFGASFEF